jgi:carbohydrate-selective porin OprB
VIRGGRFIGPLHPNQLFLDFSIMRHYGDQVEVEHRHEFLGHPGKVRVLAYRNVENMGRWDDAVAALAANPANNAAACTDFNYNSANASAPDLCYVRKRNVKVGLGVSLEQQIAADAGLFFRAMKSDGKTEVYSYTSADSSASAGVLIRGVRWGRERDTIGIAYAQNWISTQHAAYLSQGGIDGFIGDGRISYRPEKTFETYYNLNVTRATWLTFDYQRIANPAYNADRGPVTLYGLRFHAEF